MDKKLLKLRIILISILLPLIVGTYFLVKTVSDNNIQAQLDTITQNHIRVYERSYNNYKELSSIIYTGLLGRAQLKTRLYKVVYEKDTDVDKIRDNIYNDMRFRFSQLNKKEITSINIVLPDNTLFLVMKTPKKFGHKLSKYRYLPLEVTRVKKPLDSFETGKRGSGFRFSYPIEYQGKYLGQICFTFDAAAITSNIMRDFNVLSNFFIDAKYMDKKYVKKSDQYFETHYKGYLYDQRVLDALKKVANKDAYQLMPSKEARDNIYKKFFQSDAGSIYDKNKDSTITIIPIRNKISNETQAFIAIMAKADAVKTLVRNYNVILLLSIVLAIAIFIIIYFIYSKIAKDKERLMIDAIREKQIVEQSKLADMGNMIGNIAHQWRQPLSVISTLASSMKLKNEFNMLKNEEINEYSDNIVKQTKYLSNTIDTFRDFVKEEKELKEVILQSRINKAIEITRASLESHHIELINNIDYEKPIKIKITVGELVQVLINIINNAKDAIVENNINDGWIKIELNRFEDKVEITVEDNAGGIPENIISRIYEPYFTTKHKSQGTGLGLHMSYKITTESLQGRLYVKNTENGAKFFVEIPLNV